MTRTLYKNWPKILAAFLPFLLVFSWHNHMVKSYPWVSGFMLLVEPDKQIDRLVNYAAKANLLIIGSSRAKEAVRPTRLGKSLNLEGLSANGACHSCTTPDVMARLLNSPERYPRLPENLILTIEPLHFSIRYLMMARRKNLPGNFPDKPNKSLSSQEHMEKFLKSINRTISDSLYDPMMAMDPRHRRKIPKWISLLGQSGANIISGRTSPAQAFSEAYNFYIIGRARRFYTSVVNIDQGYEGHELVLASQEATRNEAFRNHMRKYENQVLPGYSEAYFDIFSDMVKRLKEKGVNIVLVRLPIYKDLYELEQKLAPSLDSHLSTIAENLDIQYFNLNKAMPDVVSNPMAFTDSSHMEHAATATFTDELAEFLRPYIKK